jgi:hypothetical protein
MHGMSLGVETIQATNEKRLAMSEQGNDIEEGAPASREGMRGSQ